MPHTLQGTEGGATAQIMAVKGRRPTAAVTVQTEHGRASLTALPLPSRLYPVGQAPDDHREHAGLVFHTAVHEHGPSEDPDTLGTW